VARNSKAEELLKIVYDGNICEAKRCKKCNEIKPLQLFYRETSGVGERKSECISCYKERKRNYRRSNRTTVNRDKQRRKEMRQSLPNNLNAWHQGMLIYNEFEGRCQLTGSTDVHLEHFIPESWGHGGTYRGNVYPMDRSLNTSKWNRNPFDWIAEYYPHDTLITNRFWRLVKYLASQNGLTVKEFYDFVRWCDENRRTIEQVRADNKRYGYKKPSLELWREATGIQFPIRIDFRQASDLNTIGRCSNDENADIRLDCANNSRESDETSRKEAI
jgi:hypothetical protein